MNRLFCLTAALSFSALCACSSTREYSFNYDQVKTALSERFDRNQWTARSTEYSTFKEPLAGTELEIDYLHRQTPYTHYELEISVRRIDAHRTEVSVFGTDYDSWFYRILNETTLQRSTHDALMQRLKTGRWGSISLEPNPYIARSDARKGNTSAGTASGVEAPAFSNPAVTPPAFSENAGSEPPPFAGSGKTASEPPPFSGSGVSAPPVSESHDVPPPVSDLPANYGDVVEEDVQF